MGEVKILKVGRRFVVFEGALCLACFDYLHLAEMYAMCVIGKAKQ